MRCTHRGLAWFGCAAALALASVGCSTGNGTEAQGSFDAYVPGATPVVRVAGVEADRVPVRLSESLVIEIGEGLAGQPNQFQVAVDGSGRVSTVDVIDGGLRRFDPSGAPLVWAATNAEVLEFDSAPLGLIAHHDDLLLINAYPGRLRLVDSSGELVSDLELDSSPIKPTSLGDGTFVAMFIETGVVGRYSVGGSELARYTVFQFPEEKLGGDTRLWPHLGVAVGRERVYTTTADKHQVSAFDVDGNSIWVLEGDADRKPIPEHISGKTLGRSRRAGRAAGGTIDNEYAQVKWPEFYPALSRIATDAADRLYVFPYVVEENPDRYPVDVYNASGTAIASGWLPFQGWDAFAGDSVYRIETREGMTVVARYELDLEAAPAGTSAGQ